jgi:hypothetical protein
MAEKNTLETEIEEARRKEHNYGWFNDWADKFVLTLSLVGSVGASFLAALGNHNREAALVAAIPAAVIAITKIFPFGARALAHWKKEYRLKGLLLKLRYEGAEEKVVSEEFREVEAKTFDEWPLLGSLPGEGREPGSMPPVEKSQKGAAAGS